MDQPSDPKSEKTLAAIERRLTKRQQRRLSGANPELAGISYYNDHKDDLIAAGLVLVLGRGETEVQRYLAEAGLAGIEVFRLHGTTVSEITSLPGMQTESFVDDSAANEQTFVDSAYALLASGRTDQIGNLLLAVDEAGLFSGTVPENPGWDYGILLTSVLDQCFRATGGEKSLPPRLVKRDNPGMAYWQAQLDVLWAMQSGEKDASQTAFNDLSQQLSTYYRSIGWEDDPIAHLALPVRGLQALLDTIK